MLSHQRKKGGGAGHHEGEGHDEAVLDKERSAVHVLDKERSAVHVLDKEKAVLDKERAAVSDKKKAHCVVK